MSFNGLDRNLGVKCKCSPTSSEIMKIEVRRVITQFLINIFESFSDSGICERNTTRGGGNLEQGRMWSQGRIRILKL